MDEALIKQLLNHRIAQSLDVHDGTPAEVEKALAELGGAVSIDAAIVHFTFGANNL